MEMDEELSSRMRKLGPSDPRFRPRKVSAVLYATGQFERRAHLRTQGTAVYPMLHSDIKHDDHDEKGEE